MNIDKILSRISYDHDCWKWNGSHSQDGYARVRNRMFSGAVHRATYTAFIGPIPVGMEIDHRCRNRGCVNPYHLDVVSHRENCNRGTHGDRFEQRTHCPSGHAYETIGRITYSIDEDGRRHQMRQCRECIRIRSSAHRAKVVSGRHTQTLRPERWSAFCRAGHEMTVQNTRLVVNALGVADRRCRMCLSAKWKRKNQRRVAASRST